MLGGVSPDFQIQECESSQAMEITSNPHVPVAVFTLADGVARKFCWDMNAMVVFAETFKEEQSRCKTEVSLMRIVLLAGFHSDAIDRGESDWNLRKMGSLLTPEILEKMGPVIEKLRKQGVSGPGESTASKSRAKKRR